MKAIIVSFIISIGVCSAQKMDEKIDLLAPRLPAKGQTAVLSVQAVVPPLVEGQSFTIKEVVARRYDLDNKVIRMRIAGMRNLEQVSPTESRVLVFDPPPATAAGVVWLYFPKEGVERCGLRSESVSPPLSYLVLVTPDKLTAVGLSVQRGVGGKVLAYIW